MIRPVVSTHLPSLSVQSFAILLSLVLSTQSQSAPPSLLPDGSMGFVHFEVAQLLETPTFGIPAALIREVSDELGMLSEQRVGLDITDLEDVTLIVPSVAQFAANKAAGFSPFVIAATFKSPFSPDNLANRFPQGWGTANAGGAPFYSNANEKAVAVVSNRTLLFGSDRSIRWCLESRNVVHNALAEFRSSSSQGQISAFVNIKAIPAQFMKAVPANAQDLLKADSVSARLDISQGGLLDVDVSYQDASEAAVASRQFRRYVDQGTAYLGQREAEARRQLADQSLDIGQQAAHLSGLAFARHAKAHLAMVRIDQDHQSVSVQFRSNHDLSDLTFIASFVGLSQSAAEKFMRVSEQLD